VDQVLEALRDPGADEPLGEGLARQDDAAAVGDGERAPRRHGALAQVPGQPAQVEGRRDHADGAAVQIAQRHRQRQDRLSDHPPLGVRADHEPASSDRVLEVGPVGEAQVRGRRRLAAGDAPLEIDRGQREQVGHLGLQGGEVGDAGRGVEGADRGDLGDGGEQVAHALEDLVELRGRELRLPQRLLAHLGLAAAAQVELVVALDRDGRQQGADDEQEQTMDDGHAPPLRDRAQSFTGSGSILH
jgi:hypothetical protein